MRCPADSWITGRNWDQSLWPGGAFPTAAVLDARRARPPGLARPGRRPRRLGQLRSDAAGRRSTEDTKAPSDGQILRDPDGKPTGVFIDGAMGLVGRAVPAPTKDDVKRRILAAQETRARKRADRRSRRRDFAGDAEVYRELDREGKLVVRVYGMASPPDGRRGRVRQPAAARPRPTGRDLSSGPSSSSSTARWARAAALLFRAVQR